MNKLAKLISQLLILIGTLVKQAPTMDILEKLDPDHSKLVSFRMLNDEKAAEFVWSNTVHARADLEQEEDDECIYRGKIEDDEDSRVLVTGCVEEEDRSIMITSAKYGDTLASERSGAVETLRWKSHLASNFRRESYASEGEGTVLPKVLQLPLQIHLAPSWRSKFLGGVKKAKEVFSLVKNMFMDTSLDTKFDIQFSNDDFFDTLAEFKPTRTNRDHLPTYISVPSEERAAVVYLAASYDCGTPHTGYSHMASICDQDRTKLLSMSCWYNSTIVTAGIVAHEIGHTLGFYHDFQPKETPVGPARTRTCGPGKDKGGPNNKIMNYNWDKVYSWSSCTNEDFRNYFLGVTDNGPFCLEESTQWPTTISYDFYTFTTPTPPTTTTTTSTPTTTTPTPTISTTSTTTNTTTTTSTTTTPNTSKMTTPISSSYNATTSPTITITTTSTSNNINKITNPKLDPWGYFGISVLFLGLLVIALAALKYSSLRNCAGRNFQKIRGDQEILLTEDDINEIPSA